MSRRCNLPGCNVDRFDHLVPAFQRLQVSVLEASLAHDSHDVGAFDALLLDIGDELDLGISGFHAVVKSESVQL